MKAGILEILRSREEVVSGEELSESLGVSRVSIWKHVQKLRALGYRIEAAPSGYRLIASPDALFPWEFGERRERMVHYPEIGSTMDAAKALAREGCAHLTTVVADKQTGGRGRLQRRWFSEPGGLYFTVVLRPEMPVLESFKLSFLASQTMAGLLRRMLAVDARVKWPNDILVDGAKLSGMLTEMEAEIDRVVFLNIGMGVNVNNDPPALAAPAVSLKRLIGREVPRKDLLAGFLDDFEARLDNLDLDRVVADWKTLAMTIGRPVKIVTAAEEIHGTAVDVDDSGALLVRQADGTVQRVIYGDCFMQ